MPQEMPSSAESDLITPGYVWDVPCLPPPLPQDVDGLGFHRLPYSCGMSPDRVRGSSFLTQKQQQP